MSDVNSAAAGPSGSGNPTSFSSGQDEPNPTLLPPPRAPLTVGNLWAALKMTKLSDLSPERLGEIPCMRQSLLQGVYGGTGFAVLRLLSGKPGIKASSSAFGWFFFGFTVVGGAANMYCLQKRTEEIEMMRLVQMRYPERNIVTAGRRAKALYEEEEARIARGEAPSKVVDPALGQTVNMLPPPKVEVSQPKFIEVHDAQGEFVGRMSPAMAELAKSRGASETFTVAPSSASAPPPPPEVGRPRGVFDAISEQ